MQQLINQIVGSSEVYPLYKRILHVSLISSSLIPLLVILEVYGIQVYPENVIPLVFIFPLIFIVLYGLSKKYPHKHWMSYAYIVTNCSIVIIDWMLVGQLSGVSPILIISIGFIIPFIIPYREIYLGNLLFAAFLVILTSISIVMMEDYTAKGIKDIVIIQTVFETILVAGFVMLVGNIIVHASYQDNLKILRLNQEAKIRNAALEQINQNKDKFLHIIAHDLRGPMGTINSTNDLLLKQFDNLSEAEREKLLLALSEMSSNTFALLENLLEWSTTEQGMYKPDIQKLDIRNVVMDAVKYMTPLYEKKEVQLIHQVESVVVYTDHQALMTILRNLLSNALKFTPSGKHVSISAMKSGQEIMVKIADEGIGMSSDQVNSLFDPDKIKSRLGTDNEKGTGLGLQLCYQLARELNADIRVSSKEKKGTTFTVIIPVNWK